MKIENIRIEAETHVRCDVDGAPCDARNEVGVPVVRLIRSPSPIVLRGVDVPAEVVEAIEKGVARHRAINAAALGDPANVRREPMADLSGPHFFSREPGE